jgi:YD repeat-containing protein
MKSIFKRYPLFSKRMIMAGFFVLLVFSCSKKTDTPTGITSHYCGTIDWKNTLGTSGYFTGTISNSQYDLGSVSITDHATNTFHAFHRTNNTSVILNDQPGYTFTYNAGKIVKLVTADGTGTGTGTATFNFDTNSHLTNSDIEGSDQTGTESLKFTYTYDINDDPVKIVGHLVSTSSSGTSTADYDISADYLTDKVNFLPLVPEMTPYSILFSYSWFLSRHLINKWVIKINGTTDQGVAIPQINFTQQYTYTYDTNGNVSTMVHTGNSKNIYTFTYSGCN